MSKLTLPEHVTDARDVLFAEPEDMYTPQEIDAMLDADAEYGEFIDRLQAEVEADLDAHLDAMYQEHLDAEYGRLAIESDKADREVMA